MTGYVHSQRARFKHHLFAGEAFCRGYAWDWLIAQARWSDGPVSIGGRTVTLRRGQLSHSVRFMADVWNWSPPAVQRFLARLKTEEMIETCADTGQLVITICNYDEYQGGAAEADTPTRHPIPVATPNGFDAQTDTGAIQESAAIPDASAAPTGPADTPPIQERYSADTNNKTEQEGQEKEGKKETLASLRAEFEGVWVHYPRKVAKFDAERAWIKARATYDYATITQPLGNYIRAVKGDPLPKILHLATWLNGKRFNDDDQSHASNQTIGAPNGRDTSGATRTERVTDAAVERALARRAELADG